MANDGKKNKDIEKAVLPKGRPSNQMEMFTALKDDPKTKGFKEIKLDRMRGIISDQDPEASINKEGTNAEATRERILEREQLLRDIDKYRDGKAKAFKGGSITKNRIGGNDYRKGGYVLSTVDNRKKKD